jgi:Kef-type K+ transport system membrane component KefB
VAAPDLARSPTAVEWAVITAAIGVIGGTLFHLFLGEERDVDRLFISLAGAIVLMTGAAAYLQLSPLLSGLFLGCILANTSRNRAEIQQVLTKVERPLYFVLLLCGGAIWTPSSNAWLVPVLMFLALRIIGKLGGARLAARFNGMLPVIGPNWGRALLGQGGLALAIAFGYLAQDNSVFPNIVFTAAVASVLLTDLVSARLVSAAVGASPEAARISGAHAAVPDPGPPGPSEAESRGPDQPEPAGRGAG